METPMLLGITAVKQGNWYYGWSSQFAIYFCCFWSKIGELLPFLTHFCYFNLKNKTNPKL
jgi:hypothetical protein